MRIHFHFHGDALAASHPCRSIGRTTRHSTPHTHEIANWRWETLQRTRLCSTPHTVKDHNDRIGIPSAEDESHELMAELAQKNGPLLQKVHQEEGITVVSTLDTPTFVSAHGRLSRIDYIIVPISALACADSLSGHEQRKGCGCSLHDGSQDISICLLWRTLCGLGRALWCQEQEG